MSRQANALGFAARIVGSGVFVGLRDADEVLDNDVLSFSVLAQFLAGVQVEVDRARQELSLTLPATDGTLLRRTVRHTPGYGCAVLPAGAPGEAALRLPDAVQGHDPRAPEPEAWPQLPRRERPAALVEALASAFAPCIGEGRDAAARMDNRALLVVHRGRIVAERYAPGFGPDSRFLSWSIGKSVAAALLGIYARQHGLELDAPAPLAQWQQDGDDPRRAVRSIDLLQMASGLDFGRPMSPEHAFTDLDLHTRPYAAAIDAEALSAACPLAHEPGSFFQYKNCDPLLVMAIIRQGLERASQDVHRWPRAQFFGPIGAASITLHTDSCGQFIPSGMMTATARDFARIGQFFLQRGHWGGKAFWPEGWYERLTTPSPANPGYGGLVWTNAAGLLPGVPADAFVLSGYFGQRVIVVPSAELVVVRLGMTLMATSDGVAPGARAQGAMFNSAFSDHLGGMISAIVHALDSTVERDLP